MIRSIPAVFIAILTLVGSATDRARAETVAPLCTGDGARVALVIGNAAYTEFSALATPRDDASAFAGLLCANGFTVQRHDDLGVEAFLAALDGFAPLARTARIAMVYYAGHGMALSGRNYLAPVDASVSCEAVQNLSRRDARALVDVEEDLLPAMAGAETQVVILDACRNDAFKGCQRSATGVGFRGLSRQTGTNRLTVFAAQDGATALDQVAGSTNSPLMTAMLAKLGAEPARDWRLLMSEVSKEVNTMTDGFQLPSVQTDLDPQVCLSEPCSSSGGETFTASLATGLAAIGDGKFETAEKNLRPFADRNDPQALIGLALAFHRSGQKSGDAIVDLLQKAADAGSADAARWLVWIGLSGLVDADPYWVGTGLGSGSGVAYDANAALEAAKTMARAGDTVAMRMLDLLPDARLDGTEAWIDRAVAAGDPAAKVQKAIGLADMVAHDYGSVFVGSGPGYSPQTSPERLAAAVALIEEAASAGMPWAELKLLELRLDPQARPLIRTDDATLRERARTAFLAAKAATQTDRSFVASLDELPPYTGYFKREAFAYATGMADALYRALGIGGAADPQGARTVYDEAMLYFEVAYKFSQDPPEQGPRRVRDVLDGKPWEGAVSTQPAAVAPAAAAPAETAPPAWNAYKDESGSAPVCYAMSPPVQPPKKPNLILFAKGPDFGSGRFQYMYRSEPAPNQEPVLRFSSGYAVTGTLARGVFVFPADDVAAIKAAAAGGEVFVEFVAADGKAKRDRYSLEGFSGSYQRMVDNCPGLVSALR